MKIELNIHHTCHSAAEFTAISERIAALLSEFSSNSAGPLRPSVTADPVLHTVVTSPVPPAPVARSEPAAHTGGDGSAELAVAANVPVAFSAAVTPDDKPKRTRRTKEQIAADEAAKAATVALPAPASVTIPHGVAVDIFAPPSGPGAEIAAMASAALNVPVRVVQPETPAPAARPPVDRTALRPLMMQVFDLENGEAIIARVLQPYGGSVAKVPEDKIGAVAVELNAAIRGNAERGTV